MVVTHARKTQNESKQLIDFANSGKVLLKRGPLHKCRAGKLARQAISDTWYQSEVVEPRHPPRLLAQGRLTINQRKRSKSAEIGDRRGRIEAQCDGWRGISLGA
ncbi:hypothetical protein VNO78_35127 [Psophocarpus tetragonolobus]|uniref:Uncharacterized protein n=1 Tax=Psophocarpus tetragonolobus TaxID=3891 RepID=A0AAN9RKB5_PSOTE